MGQQSTVNTLIKSTSVLCLTSEGIISAEKRWKEKMGKIRIIKKIFRYFTNR